MLTRNFYKLATVQQYEVYFRKNDTSGTDAPYIDIINANGKIICKSDVTDTEKYEKVSLDSDRLDGYNYYGQYKIASLPTGTMENTRFSVLNSGQTRTVTYHSTAFNDRDNNINSDASSTHCTSGAPILYIGNGTTEPTKDDYTMESCLTNYTISACSVTHKLNDGIILINFSILPNEDLQLSEIGVFTSDYPSNSRSLNVTPKSRFAMVCHDVFTPVTLPANKTVTINYTINLSELTAETTIG